MHGYVYIYIYIYIYSLQLAAVLRTLVAAAFHAVNMQACMHKIIRINFQECHIYLGNNNDETLTRIRILYIQNYSNLLNIVIFFVVLLYYIVFTRKYLLRNAVIACCHVILQ